MAHIDASDIQCMQRKMNSEVVITFKSVDVKEKFLRLNALTVGEYSYAAQDTDRPMTFLTIYDAPFELSDLAINRRLAPFCEVVHYRRGKFDFMPGVYNGLRHYRVRVTKPVPSFIRFGKYQILLKHDGQVPTCRRCNLAGHFSNDCNLKVCFNCENIAHEAGSCPASPLCHFCKEAGHTSRECGYSWVSSLIKGTTTDESAPVNVDCYDGEDSAASLKTRSGDSFKWAEDSDLCNEDEEDDDFRDAEAQPLAAVLHVSTLPADPSSFEPSENESAATEPSTAKSTAVGQSVLAAVLPTESLPNAQPNQTAEKQASPADHGTDVLPTESLPDAQPNQTAENQAFPADHGTDVLPTESLPNAQPNQTAKNQASPADHGTDVLPTESLPDAQPNQTAENQASPADHGTDVLPTESLPNAQPNQTAENQASPADHGTDVLPTESLPDAQPNQTAENQASPADHVLPTESLPDAKPNQTAENQASPADHQPDGVPDSQGFIKTPVVINDLSQPSYPSTALHSSASKNRVSVRVPRLTRRTFAVAPTALEAAALRKKNHPFVSEESQTPAASSTPMETTVDLKRKAQAQADAPPKERREKKKGRK